MEQLEIYTKDLIKDEQDDYMYILYREQTLNNFFIPKCINNDIADEIEKAKVLFSIETEQLKLSLLSKIAKRLNNENIVLMES